MPLRCKNWFVEIVMFVSLFTLLGHVSVTFWERYMLQAELNKMKTSLHGLKLLRQDFFMKQQLQNKIGNTGMEQQYTVDAIGTAYDNLHEELQILAHVTEPKGKSRSIYTDKILSSPHPNLILAHSDSGTTRRNPQSTQSQTANIIKDIYAQSSFRGQEQFTNTDSNDRADKVVITPSIRDKVQNTEYFEKRDARTYTANAINAGNSAKRPLASVKINTRNPLVSSAAGRGSSHNREIQTFAHCKQRDPNSNKIHHCHRDEIAVGN